MSRSWNQSQGHWSSNVERMNQLVRGPTMLIFKNFKENLKKKLRNAKKGLEN